MKKTRFFSRWKYVLPTICLPLFSSFPATAQESFPEPDMTGWKETSSLTNFFPPVKHLVLDCWSKIRIQAVSFPEKDSAKAVCLVLSSQKPVRNEASKSVHDSETATLTLSNLSGTLQIDTFLCRPESLFLSEGVEAEGILCFVENLNLKAENTSQLRLYYAADHIRATAVHASTLELDGRGPIRSQHLRAGGGSSIISRHSDTARSLHLYATNFSTIDASRSPCLLSYDTLDKSIVQVTATRSRTVSKNGSMFVNHADTLSGKQAQRKAIRYTSSSDISEFTYLEDLIPAKNLKFRKKKNRFKGQWMGLEFKMPMWGQGYGFGTALPDPYRDMELNLQKSIGIAWNVFQISVGFNSSRWGLVTGMGFLWENYRFSRPDAYLNIKDYRLEVLTDSDPQKHYTKSKLGVSYFRIPILFEYNNARGAFRTFHVSAGVIPGVLMADWTKRIYENPDGSKGKVKSKDDYYVNPFRLDAACYVGWGPLSFYFTYSPLHFFRQGKGPGLTPFSVGFLIGCH